jgi:two-component system, OmpR family, sensor kinase
MSDEALPRLGLLPRGSLRRRIVWSTALLTAVGMLLLTGLVQLVLARIVSNEVDGVLADRANAVLRLVAAGGGQLDPTTAPGGLVDDHVWAFDASGRLVGGSSIPDGVEDELKDLATATTRSTVDNDDYRLLAVPVPVSASAATTPHVIVVGEPLAPYETTETYALVASLAVGVLVVIGVSAVVTWSVSRALSPVATMASRAADWSEHDLSRRFDLGPANDEIAALGQTLDGLLDRVSKVILAEQRLTSELAHELRTPLTAVRAEAELLLRRGTADADQHETLERIVAAVDQMTTTITTLITAARAPTSLGETTSARRVVQRAVDATAAGSQVQIDPRAALDASLSVPEAVAVRALTPVLENALRYARDAVKIDAQIVGSGVEIIVRDDGPGLSIDPEEAFSAGTHEQGSPGAGLGLSLARRLARGLGGDLVASAPAPVGGGAVFVLTLPRRSGSS